MKPPKDIWLHSWVQYTKCRFRHQIVTQVFCRTRPKLNKKTIYQTSFQGEIAAELAIHWAKQLFEHQILNVQDDDVGR